jgi:hypothetical protein
MSTFIKRLGDISKPFLSSGVPDIKGDRLSVILDPFDFEIDTDCTQVISLKCVITVADE